MSRAVKAPSPPAPPPAARPACGTGGRLARKIKGKHRAAEVAGELTPPAGEV